jgi:hypothetical protein
MARSLDTDATRRQQSADDLGNADSLGDAEADSILAQPPDPTPAAQAAADTEDRPDGLMDQVYTLPGLLKL